MTGDFIVVLIVDFRVARISMNIFHLQVDFQVVLEADFKVNYEVDLKVCELSLLRVDIINTFQVYFKVNSATDFIVDFKVNLKWIWSLNQSCLIQLQ